MQFPLQLDRLGRPQLLSLASSMPMTHWLLYLAYDVRKNSFECNSR